MTKQAEPRAVRGMWLGLPVGTAARFRWLVGAAGGPIINFCDSVSTATVKDEKMEKLTEIQRVQLRIDCDDEQAAEILEIMQTAMAAGIGGDGEKFLDQLARIQAVEKSALELAKLLEVEVGDEGR